MRRKSVQKGQTIATGDLQKGEVHKFSHETSYRIGLRSNSEILYGIWVFGLDLITDSTSLNIGDYIIDSQVGEVAISVGTRL